jgi:hypothetical protein
VTSFVVAGVRVGVQPAQKAADKAKPRGRPPGKSTKPLVTLKSTANDIRGKVLELLEVECGLSSGSFC